MLAEFAEDTKHARNTHSAIFAEVKVDEQLYCPGDARGRSPPVAS
jgi:hypothetical protein